MDDFSMALQRRRSVNPIRKALGNALVTLGTGKVQDSEEDNYLDKLYAQEAIKSQFRQKNPNQNYLLDENGDVVPLPSGRIIQRPFGLSDTAKERFESRQSESLANREAGLAKAGYLQEGQGQENGEITVNIGGKTYKLSRELAEEEARIAKAAKTIPDSDKDTLSALGNTVNLMSSINSRVSDPNNKLGVDPNSFRYENNPVMNEYGKRVMTPEQAQFKADITDATNVYLKAQSGVQRGFKEIEFLKSAFPEARSKPENFTAQAEGVIGRSIAQMDFVVDALRKSGYDVTEFEADLNNYKQQYANLVSKYAGDYQSKFRKPGDNPPNDIEARKNSLRAKYANR